MRRSSAHFEEIIRTLLILNSEGTNIPLTTLVNLERETSYSTISAGREAKYIPVIFNDPGNRPAMLANNTEEIVRQV